VSLFAVCRWNLTWSNTVLRQQSLFGKRLQAG
jgi:hypothetical protein